MNYQPYLWRACKQRLLRSKKPILVGPWRSEVGFEVLYWLPFLEQLVADGVDRERLIPITRGGAACWYGTPTGLELYAMRSPKDVRIENKLQHRQTGLLKQIRCTKFDKSVIEDAAATLGLKSYHVIHPSWMYNLFTPFWESHVGLTWLNARTRWTVIPPPPLPGDLTLPEEFVAVRFYQRATLPGHEMTLQAIRATVGKVASQTPVIVLHNDSHVDDHVDMLLSKMPNVTLLRDLAPLNPETNLAVQSAVLAHAAAFVGTYGGFAQLALRLGRSVVSYYDQWGGTAIAHKHLADALSIQMGIPFQVYALRELALASNVLPMVTVTQKPQHLDTVKQPTSVG